MSKNISIFVISEKFTEQIREKFLDKATKPGLHTAKPAFRNAVHKTAAVIGELIGNKITEKL